MAEIVNLRQVRKQKDRESAKARGTQAAAKSGRSKALKALEKSRADSQAQHLDNHLRDDPTRSD